MAKPWIFMAVAVFLATSLYLILADDGSDVTEPKRSTPPVVSVPVSDSEMNTAMARARATIDLFIEELPRLRADGARIAVKYPLSENGVTEHVWLADPVFDGRRFDGYLGSVPAGLPSWSFGDQVSASLDEISDWMAIEDGTLYGGFTIHALRGRLTAAERQAQDQRLGFPLPDKPALWERPAMPERR